MQEYPTRLVEQQQQSARKLAQHISSEGVKIQALKLTGEDTDAQVTSLIEHLIRQIEHDSRPTSVRLNMLVSELTAIQASVAGCHTLLTANLFGQHSHHTIIRLNRIILMALQALLRDALGEPQSWDSPHATTNSWKAAERCILWICRKCQAEWTTSNSSRIANWLMDAYLASEEIGNKRMEEVDDQTARFQLGRSQGESRIHDIRNARSASAIFRQINNQISWHISHGNQHLPAQVRQQAVETLQQEISRLADQINSRGPERQGSRKKA